MKGEINRRMHKLKTIVAITAILATAAALPSMAANNRVTNGSFSILSPLSFKSDYTKHSYPTSNPSKGTGHDHFELGPVAQSDNSSWISSGDHTTGTGNFMLVDGSTTGSTTNGSTSAYNGTARVWYESFNVVANRQYSISAWAENFLNKNNANLIFTINGNQVGTNTILGTAGIWQNMNASWTAATTGKITFAIVDKQTASSGNDFGLDDISFKPVPEASTVVTFALLCVGGFLTLRKRRNATASA